MFELLCCLIFGLFTLSYARPEASIHISVSVELLFQRIRANLVRGIDWGIRSGVAAVRAVRTPAQKFIPT